MTVTVAQVFADGLGHDYAPHLLPLTNGPPAAKAEGVDPAAEVDAGVKEGVPDAGDVGGYPRSAPGP